MLLCVFIAYMMMYTSQYTRLRLTQVHSTVPISALFTHSQVGIMIKRTSRPLWLALLRCFRKLRWIYISELSGAARRLYLSYIYVVRLFWLDTWWIIFMYCVVSRQCLFSLFIRDMIHAQLWLSDSVLYHPMTFYFNFMIVFFIFLMWWWDDVITFCLIVGFN